MSQVSEFSTFSSAYCCDVSTSHGHYFVIGWLILSKCRQYHFVSQPLTWHEAASYCSTQYTGLAVTEDTNEMNQLKKRVSSADYKSVVWIDLYTHISYYKKSYREDDFIKESQKIEMAPFFVSFFCLSISLNGVRWNYNCSMEHPFICYNGEHALKHSCYCGYCCFGGFLL